MPTPTYTYSIFEYSTKGKPSAVVATLTDAQGVKPVDIMKRAITEGFVTNPGQYTIVISEDGRPIQLHGPVPVVMGKLQIDPASM